MTTQQLLFRSDELGLAANCPFFDPAKISCGAALLRFRPEGSHLSGYCCSDEHDDCALFLAKALRSSAPRSLARDVAPHAEK